MILRANRAFTKGESAESWKEDEAKFHHRRESKHQHQHCKQQLESPRQL